MNYKIKMIILLTIIVLIGCVDYERNNAIEAKMQELETKMQELETNIKSLEFGVHEFERSILLTVGSKDYLTLRYDLGYLTVLIDNIEPYANGSKAKIGFGNISNAKLNDISFTIDWGRLMGSEYIMDIPYHKTMKTKEVKLSKSFESGSWNYENIILEEFPFDSLGFIRIKNLKSSGIGLVKRN